MRINTRESITTAKAVRDRYGSWAEAKQAARDEPRSQGDISDSKYDGKLAEKR